jgi:hypothetical protein
MTPSGIELATFRLEAQHLNHCATAETKSESTMAKESHSIRQNCFQQAKKQPQIEIENNAGTLTNYVSTLSQYDNSILKPIKSSRKPILASPPLRLETPTPERRAKSDKEKATVFAKHLADVFQPHE